MTATCSHTTTEMYSRRSSILRSSLLANSSALCGSIVDRTRCQSKSTFASAGEYSIVAGRKILLQLEIFRKLLEVYFQSITPLIFHRLSRRLSTPAFPVRGVERHYRNGNLRYGQFLQRLNTNNCCSG